MTVYKYFLRVAFRARKIILGYAVIFFILTLLNSSGIDENEKMFSERALDIGIVNESKSELSKSLIEHLGQKNNIDFVKNDKKAIQESIFLEVLDAVVVVPKDFEQLFEDKEKAVEITRDERKIESNQISSEINKFLRFTSASFTDHSYDLERVRAILDEEVEVKFLDSEVSSEYNDVRTWFSGYFNFTAYVIVAIYIAVIGLVMREFNDENIQERMKVSSKEFLNFNIQIYLGQISLAILITAAFVLVAVLFKGKYISEVNLSKYILNISVFSFAILGLTFLINNLTRSSFIINAASTVFSLGTALISGVMVSQEYLGESVLNIAKFFPTYYFVKINNMRIHGFMEIRYELLIQILFGISFFLLGLYFSKVKRRA